MAGDVLKAALEAYDEGLCVFRARIDGTKRPMGAWKEFQSKRPSRQAVERWFEDGHPGIGIICGAVSGNLEMFEFEGRAIAEGLFERFCEACDDNGLGDLLNRIMAGYCEVTPSGGYHVLYRCDDIAGNTKLARRWATLEEWQADPDDEIKVLIETRGEGGFTIVAPSWGPTHDTGQPWEMISGSFPTIATITAGERTALWQLAEMFDRLSEPKPWVDVEPEPAPDNDDDTFWDRLEVASWRRDGSWVDDLCGELARRSWHEVLGEFGWTHVSHSNGIDYWRRPGKDKGDHSATTNGKGTDRLIVFSSSTPFRPYDGVGPAPSYDRLDVIATYRHGGDRMAAARALRPEQARPGHATSVGADATEITAERPLLLPDEFWDARPAFGHIRLAARSRLLSPDGLLGAVLARVALLTDWRVVLPPIVGRYGTLDVLVALVGPPGLGKGSSIDTASELLPVDESALSPDYKVTTIPVGSGEGMVHAYFEKVVEKEDGRRRTIHRRAFGGVLCRIDEGQALGALAARSGQTTMTTLRSAWSGEALGGSYASDDKKVTLSPMSYRFAGVMAIQPELAADLLNDAAGGTPQRFTWLSLHDPDAPPDPNGWPGRLPFSPPRFDANRATMLSTGCQAMLIDVAASVVAEIKGERLARLRGAAGLDPNAHRALGRLKVAALLGILDGRLEVSEDDWRLAGMILDASSASIAEMRKAITDADARRDQVANDKARQRAEASEIGRASAADEIGRVARVMARHVQKHATADRLCGRRCLRDAVASRDREIAAPALARALAVGLITEGEEGSYAPGLPFVGDAAS